MVWKWAKVRPACALTQFRFKVLVFKVASLSSSLLIRPTLRRQLAWQTVKRFVPSEPRVPGTAKWKHAVLVFLAPKQNLKNQVASRWHLLPHSTTFQIRTRKETQEAKPRQETQGRQGFFFFLNSVAIHKSKHFKERREECMGSDPLFFCPLYCGVFFFCFVTFVGTSLVARRERSEESSLQGFPEMSQCCSLNST